MSQMQRRLVVACAVGALTAVASAIDNSETFAFSDGNGASSLSGASFDELLASLGGQEEAGSVALVHPNENRNADLKDDNGEERSVYSGEDRSFSTGECRLLLSRVCCA